MIEAAIWDFGGVITSSPFEAFAQFERENGLEKDFIRSINATNPDDNAWAKLERAEIDRARFDEMFAAEARARGGQVRGADVLNLLAGDVRPQMVEALRRIHGRIKTGCITNNVPKSASSEMAGMYKGEIMALFHHVIESAKIGVRKPDPAIYAMMTEALGVAPEKCVYLNDLGVNLKPARAMGMRTIKVGDPDVALNELEAIVGFALR